MEWTGLSVLMCLMGLLGPATALATKGALARDSKGLMHISQGGALMLLGACSLVLSNWAGSWVPVYVGCLLIASATGYWLEGLRQIAGLGESYENTRKVVAGYSIGLGVILWTGDEKSGMIYNAVSCGMMLLVCMHVCGKTQMAGKTKKIATWAIGTLGAFAFIWGFGLAGSPVDALEGIGKSGFLSGMTVLLAVEIAMIGMSLMASEKIQTQLVREATTDYLSGALNRRETMRRGSIEIERCIRQKEFVAVIMIDIDFFKKINDQHGHPVGDTVIADLARKITAMTRAYDIVGRYGGEEFVAVLPGASEWVASNIGERIRELVERTSQNIPAYTVSVGVCCGRNSTLTQLVGHADEALYKAKSTGRNKVCVSDYGREQVRGKLKLVSNN